MTLRTKLDNATTFATAQNALAKPLSSHLDDAYLNVSAIYVFILKAFCITGLLGWVLIACPDAVADELDSAALLTSNFEQPYAFNLPDSGWKTHGGAQYNSLWLQQDADNYKSVDGLHAGVRRLRQILSNWWASNPDQSSMATQLKSMMTAKGEGQYAAWSYNIGASTKALEISIRYEF